MNASIRQGLFFLVLIAVPITAYFVVFKPRNQEIMRAREEIAHKQARLDQLREQTAQSDTLADANEKVRESIEAIEARLPSDKEMDDVLRQVSQIAERSGLKLLIFRKGDRALPAGLAMEQPIRVELTGDFDGFYSFLLDLEQMPRITRIPDMELSRSRENDGEMMAKFTLSIYYQDKQTP